MKIIRYIDIDWPDLFLPIMTAKTNYFNRIRVRREIIPIVFVPGTMGSRLKGFNDKGKYEVVWDPSNSIFMGVNYGLICPPALRKKRLIGEKFDPEYLQVSEDDAKHNKKFHSEADPTRAQRGWGGICWTSYGGLLKELQNCFWNQPVKEHSRKQRSELAGQCFEFPVHAFGYNWTDSNTNSGRKLALQIDEIIQGYKSQGRLCKYVILVTHSMGGLVARSACMLHGAASQVLGVVHGVQPAVGAAAAYWRMKAGFERKGLKSAMVARVLGATGEAVTCVLANAPGGLELLPTRDYTANDGSKQWLRFSLHDGKSVTLPQYNPYQEIYRLGSDPHMATRKPDATFWRLVNPDWLDPQSSGKSKQENAPWGESSTSWDEYLDCLNKAEAFHKRLGTGFHARTYQFISSGLTTVDDIAYRHEPYDRQGHIFACPYIGVVVEPSHRPSSSGRSVLLADRHHQQLAVALPEPRPTFAATMKDKRDYTKDGDGTVPDSSGMALREHNGHSILHESRFKNIDHQDVYKKRVAKDFVMTAIRNLAQKRIDEALREGGVGTAR
jgi:pimeloyl-ACP methyl ester carboxylesterase